MTDFPIAPVVGRSRPETQAVRDFIACTENIACVMVPLSRGKAFCLVDRADWIRLELWRWHWTWVQASAGYAGHNVYIGKISGKHLYRFEYMHRLILGAGDGIEVDHRNLDSLDNRRANLRLAKHAENMRNKPVRRDSKTGICGVHFSQRGDYIAYIDARGLRKYLGRYQTIEAASAARDAAARKYHGEFARTA